MSILRATQAAPPQRGTRRRVEVATTDPWADILALTRCEDEDEREALELAALYRLLWKMWPEHARDAAREAPTVYPCDLDGEDASGGVKVKR